MKRTYRSARGEVVDFDKLRLANETTIAVGNIKTNTRGDELGPGGKIIKTRAQIMQEYHKLNTPVADNTPISTNNLDDEMVQEIDLLPVQPPKKQK